MAKSKTIKPKKLTPQQIENRLSKLSETPIDVVVKEMEKKQKSKTISYEKMSESELKALGNQLVSMLNKRIRRMEQKGELSQAYAKLEQERGSMPRFSIDFRGLKLTKEQRKKRLIDEIKRMKQYERLAQSSLRGTTKQHTQIKKRLKKMGVSFDSKADERLFFGLYDRWKELAKDNPKLNKYKPSEAMKLLKQTYDRYAQKGIYDEKKIFESVKRKIYKEQRDLAIVEGKETKELFSRGR